MNAQAATLRFAALPRRSLLADTMLVLAGTGLVAGAAQISVTGAWRVVERTSNR